MACPYNSSARRKTLCVFLRFCPSFHCAFAPLRRKYRRCRRDQLDNVTKRYGRRVAVEGLCRGRRQARCSAFLGRTARGRPATHPAADRLFTSLHTARFGCWAVICSDRVRRTLPAVRLATCRMWPDSSPGTGEQLLDELAALQGRPPIDRQYARAALELARDDLRRPLGALPRGTRQKVNLIPGIAAPAELLFWTSRPKDWTRWQGGAARLAARGTWSRSDGLSRRIFWARSRELCDRVALIRGGNCSPSTRWLAATAIGSPGNAAPRVRHFPLTPGHAWRDWRVCRICSVTAPRPALRRLSSSRCCACCLSFLSSTLRSRRFRWPTCFCV